MLNVSIIYAYLISNIYGYNNNNNMYTYFYRCYDRAPVKMLHVFTCTLYIENPCQSDGIRRNPH